MNALSNDPNLVKGNEGYLCKYDVNADEIIASSNKKDEATSVTSTYRILEKEAEVPDERVIAKDKADKDITALLAEEAQKAAGAALEAELKAKEDIESST